jgi:hypothetical protein
MTNSKLLKLAALALVSATALTAQLAFADNASCGNWSFNDSSCSAYIKPSVKAAEANVTASAEPASCGNWSFNNPSCSAYIKPSAKKAEAIVSASAEPASCANWSYNDASCSAYIRH